MIPAMGRKTIFHNNVFFVVKSRKNDWQHYPPPYYSYFWYQSLHKLSAVEYICINHNLIAPSNGAIWNEFSEQHQHQTTISLLNVKFFVQFS